MHDHASSRAICTICSCSHVRASASLLITLVRNTVGKYEKNNFVKEWGQNSYGFAFAHAVRVDKDDNVWVVDEGSNMVMKFNPQGRVTMVLGRKDEAIDYLEEFLEDAAHTERGRNARVGAGAYAF